MPSGVDLDVSFGALEIERDLVASARVVPGSGPVLPLPRAEDLVILEAVAGRPRDAADIGGRLETHPGLDRRRVRSAVVELADLLDSPEIVTMFDRIFVAVPLARETRRSDMEGRARSRSVSWRLRRHGWTRIFIDVRPTFSRVAETGSARAPRTPPSAPS